MIIIALETKEICKVVSPEMGLFFVSATFLCVKKSSKRNGVCALLSAVRILPLFLLHHTIAGIAQYLLHGIGGQVSNFIIVLQCPGFCLAVSQFFVPSSLTRQGFKCLFCCHIQI